MFVDEKMEQRCKIMEYKVKHSFRIVHAAFVKQTYLSHMESYVTNSESLETRLQFLQLCSKCQKPKFGVEGCKKWLTIQSMSKTHFLGFFENIEDFSQTIHNLGLNLEH